MKIRKILSNLQKIFPKIIEKNYEILANFQNMLTKKKKDCCENAKLCRYPQILKVSAVESQKVQTIG